MLQPRQVQQPHPVPTPILMMMMMMMMQSPAAAICSYFFLSSPIPCFSHAHRRARFGPDSASENGSHHLFLRRRRPLPQLLRQLLLLAKSLLPLGQTGHLHAVVPPQLRHLLLRHRHRPPLGSRRHTLRRQNQGTLEAPAHHTYYFPVAAHILRTAGTLAAHSPALHTELEQVLVLGRSPPLLLRRALLHRRRRGQFSSTQEQSRLRKPKQKDDRRWENK